MRALKHSIFALSFCLMINSYANDNSENQSQSKTIDLSYTHFQKTGNVLLSIVPHNLEDFTVTVTDNKGKEVFTKEYTSNYIENVDLSHLLKEGVYTITVSHNNLEYQKSKIIL